MKIFLASAMVAGMTVMSAHAFADDSAVASTKAHKQMMKECMTEQKAKNDGSTAAKMRATCKAQIKDEVVNQGTVNDKSMNAPR